MHKLRATVLPFIRHVPYDRPLTTMAPFKMVSCLSGRISRTGLKRRSRPNPTPVPSVVQGLVSFSKEKHEEVLECTRKSNNTNHQRPDKRLLNCCRSGVVLGSAAAWIPSRLRCHPSPVCRLFAKENDGPHSLFQSIDCLPLKRF